MTSVENTNSSTKNTKGNRQVVSASYAYPDMYFKIPDGIDLEDKNVVENWYVKYGTLNIIYVDGREEEIGPVHDPYDFDFKWATDTEICDADYCGVEYSEDEEEEEKEEEENYEVDEETGEKFNMKRYQKEEKEEDCVYNFYMCRICCYTYPDETEVDCKHCGRKMCVNTYQARNKGEALSLTMK